MVGKLVRRYGQFGCSTEAITFSAASSSITVTVPNRLEQQERRS